ncbi:MAG: protoporphyrinogen oxidase, partial [Desulfovibrio sp.]|nr:protoporphyrinogen oxidase [Desulfovibrio sp.]
ARDFARQMAELQGDATEPREEGRFWVFEGEPRTQALRGRATTMVTATPERLLIIIVQDPEELGGADVAASLRGLDDEARALLGR